MSRRLASSIVVADHPLRQQLAELVALLATRRDAIAEADLSIASLREELLAFEQRYHTELSAAHTELRQVTRVLRYIAQLITLLQGPKVAGNQLNQQIEHINRRKQAELGADKTLTKKPYFVAQKNNQENKDALVCEADEHRRLKRAFIALVRRYHPDLAQQEDIRQRNGRLMARINELYKKADAVRLEAMVDQAEATEAGLKSLEISLWDDLAEQVSAAEQRLCWFDTVLKNLQDEQRMLVRGPTFTLRQRIETKHDASGNLADVYQNLRCEITTERDGALAQIPTAMRTLEHIVDMFNSQTLATYTAKMPLDTTTRQTGTDVTRFDPHANKGLIRLGLTQLAALNVAPHVKREADRLNELATTNPSVARLVLLTYVAELSPQPLPALETFTAVSSLLAQAARNDPQQLQLAQILVLAAKDVEYAVRTTPQGMVFAGLKFCRPALQQAVPLALRNFMVRQLFTQLLLHLGEQRMCRRCNQEVWAIPLYRLLGLDNLRALVCPTCTTMLSSYFLPKGHDVQAILNDAFLDFDLVEQVVCRFAGSSIVMQMLPLELEKSTVATIKSRLLTDVFDRHDLAIESKHFFLCHEGTELTEETSLAALCDHQLDLLFTNEAPLTPAEALEALRFRIRNRFSRTTRHQT